MFRALGSRVAQAGGAAAAVGAAASYPTVAEPLQAFGTASSRQGRPVISSGTEVPGGWEDEWGFVDNSGREISRPQGDAPKAEEVEEIVRELQVTTRRHAPLSLQNTEIQECLERVEGAESSTVQRVAMPFTLSLEQTSRGERLVAQALDLFNKDKRVQETVVALATDKHVWQAMMNNPAMRALQAEQAAARSDQVAVLPGTPTAGAADHGTRTSSSIFDKIQQVLSSVLDFVKDFFKGGNESKGASDDKPTEPSADPVAMICFFLANVIVMYVIIKRGF